MFAVDILSFCARILLVGDNGVEVVYVCVTEMRGWGCRVIPPPDRNLLLRLSKGLLLLSSVSGRRTIGLFE